MLYPAVKREAERVPQPVTTGELDAVLDHLRDISEDLRDFEKRMDQSCDVTSQKMASMRAEMAQHRHDLEHLATAISRLQVRMESQLTFFVLASLASGAGVAAFVFAAVRVAS